MMEQIKHSFLPTNGLHMHVAEIGSGPLVLLLHGFPEIWYSWRHQMLGLANAGFRAIAPDHRGYGLSENTDPTKIDWTDLVDDLVALLNALGEEQAFVVAKDWGSGLAYALGYMHPQRVRAIVSLGGIHTKPGMAKLFREGLPPGHYIKRFLDPGVAEADFGRFDVATVVKRIYILFCNSSMPVASENEQILDLVKPSDRLPKWMTEEDLRAYAELYQKSGFEYPLQVPYRSLSRVADKVANLKDFTIRAPVLLVIGNCDYATNRPGLLQLLEAQKDLLPHVKVTFLEEGTHFMQEQLPTQVNQLILDFFTPFLSE